MLPPEVGGQINALFGGKAGYRVTALPRNFTPRQSPISNRAGGGLQSGSNRLDSAELVNQFFSHAPLSQIVTLDASANSHNLCVARVHSERQSVWMDDQEKNGGPNHLKEWRAFRGLSQAELAEAVGTNANMIGYLENGERGLSAKWLRRLAPALQTTPGLLLDHDPSNIDRDVLETWLKAGDREKRQIAEIAKALVRDGTSG